MSSHQNKEGKEQKKTGTVKMQKQRKRLKNTTKKDNSIKKIPTHNS